MTNKRITGDSACPSCRATGGDKTGNHLIHFENDEGERWGFCPKCRHYEKFEEGNVPESQPRREITPEEAREVVAEISEYPIMEMKDRKILKATAERFGVRTSLSPVDGSTPDAYYYPRHVDGVITGYEVKGIEKKWFFNAGAVAGAEFFGQQQAMMGDVWSKKLFIFEDGNSAMSAYQVFVQNAKQGAMKVACVALPTGAHSIASVMTRNMKFVDGFEEVVICMDNDEAGEEALKKARALRPDIKFCRIPKGEFKRETDGSVKAIKDANDMLMAGRSHELFNKLVYSAKNESPASSVTVFDCLAEALKKPEWGIPWPWKTLNDMTYGLRYGELISIGGGVGGGKSLIGHELVAHLCLKHNERVGVCFLEETNGNTLKNIAGKSARMPFHRPDLEYEPSTLVDEVNKYGDKLFLYNNFGTSEWDEIKVAIRHWVVSNGCKFIILDNMTAMVGHLSASEQNTEIGRIAAELAGMCQELNFTAFVFSHLNEPKGGKSHENGGEVLESQFTGSRALMRWSQLILGFERNKQEPGNGKHNSVIRLLKDRNFGNSGVVYTKYNPDTGNLTERSEDEVDKSNHFRDVDAIPEEGAFDQSAPWAM